jgi:hypothetical protein
MKIFNFKKFNENNRRTFNEAIKMNGFSVSNTTINEYTFISDGKVSEAIDFEFEKKGGIIVFSTDVNALDYSENEFVNKVKQVLTSIMNRVFTRKKVSKVMKKHDKVYGFTIGKFVKGRYKAEDGSIYDENSTSVEIIGIDSESLLSVAEDIATEFNQETVLVKDYQKDSIYLANDKKDDNVE